jgi:hypothetical protein
MLVLSGRPLLILSFFDGPKRFFPNRQAAVAWQTYSESIVVAGRTYPAALSLPVSREGVSGARCVVVEWASRPMRISRPVHCEAAGRYRPVHTSFNIFIRSILAVASQGSVHGSPKQRRCYLPGGSMGSLLSKFSADRPGFVLLLSPVPTHEIAELLANLANRRLSLGSPYP